MRFDNPTLVKEYAVTSGFLWGIMTCPGVNHQGTCYLLVCKKYDNHGLHNR